MLGFIKIWICLHRSLGKHVTGITTEECSRQYSSIVIILGKGIVKNGSIFSSRTLFYQVWMIITE